MSCALLNSECLQLLDDVGTVRGGGYMPIDREDPPVATDEKRPPLCESARRKHAVRVCRRFRRIAENRIVDAERCSKLGVGVRLIDARRIVLDVEPPQRVAARPERPAFGRSPSCKCFREPRQYDGRSADKVSKLVRAAIGALKRKVGSTIAGFERGRRMMRAKHLVGQSRGYRNGRRGNRSQHRIMPF